jgi:hypothetical protein
VSNIVPRILIYIDKVAMADIKNPTSRQVVIQALKAEEVAMTYGEKLHYLIQFKLAA